MTPLEQISFFKLMQMVEAKLISYKETSSWADSHIEVLEKPPAWLCELSMAKDHLSVQGIIASNDVNQYQDPIGDVNLTNNYFIACLFQLYKQEKISWSDFLNQVGLYTDERNMGCEYFYAKLNTLEDSKDSNKVEQDQVDIIYSRYEDVITQVQTDYSLVIVPNT